MDLEAIKSLNGKRVGPKTYDKIKASECVIDILLLNTMINPYAEEEYEYKISLCDDTDIRVIGI